jgi:hypothetical protein
LIDQLKEFRCYREPEQSVSYDANLAKQKHDEVLDTLVKYDIRIVAIHWDLFGAPNQCGAARQFIDTLVGDQERWKVLLDTPQKTSVVVKALTIRFAVTSKFRTI